MTAAGRGGYLHFTRAVIQQQLTYRINFLFNLIVGPLFCFVNYYLWAAVYKSSGQSTLSGFQLPDMVMYLFLMPVVGAVMAERAYIIMSDEVKSGMIATQLIKPFSYRLRLFAESMGRKLSSILFYGLPILIGLMIYRYVSTGNLPDWIHILRFLLSLVLGLIVSFFFWYIVGILSFYTTNAWGTHLIIGGINMIVSGRLFPLDFLPHWAQVAFTFHPQQASYYVPTMALIGHWDSARFWSSVGLQLFWIVFLFALGSWMWHRAVRHLTIQGG